MTLNAFRLLSASLLLVAATADAAGADSDPALYELPGERVIIGRFDFGVESAEQAPMALFVTDAGQIVVLTQDAPDRYSYPGGSLTIADGGITWQRGSDSVQGSRSRAIRHEAVRFGSLEGRLTLPAGEGPHPVLVMLHGSGRASRDFAYYGLLAAHLAGKGLGVLTWDKRSDWRAASVQDLAEDAVAAIDYVRSRSDVDRERVGTYGHSQGGWLAPLVAVKRNASFVCVVAAPAVSTSDQELDEAANDLRRRGFGDDEVREAQAALREMFRVISTGEGADHLGPLVARVRAKPWGRYIDLTANPDELAQLRRSAYDPRPSLEALRVPVLALFGEADRIVPPGRNVPLWKQYARGARLEVEVFPGADHGLFVTPAKAHAHDGSGQGNTRQYAAGVVDRITDWLLRAAGLPDRQIAPGEAPRRTRSSKAV